MNKNRIEGAADGFFMMYVFQRSCEIQIRAQSTGSELIHIPQEVEANTIAMTVAMNSQRAGNVKHLDGELLLPGLMRCLDRLRPGFRD